MIPPYYEFFNSVKIISGNKAIEQLPHELDQLGVGQPIIVTDKGISEAGLARIVIKAFAGTKIKIGAVFDDTPVDSSSVVANEVAGIYRENGCDSIIAVGGGSVIDTAKGANIVISEGTDDLLKFTGNNRLRKPMRPFFVIPTTGSGSEVTLAAVIKNPEKNIKMSFTSPLMLPKAAILDPRMTVTMPPKFTAATGMDALTHAVEACMGLQKNPVSDAFAFSAIDLIRQNLINAVRDGQDKTTRLAMANATLLAGLAFSNSMVGVVHAVAHALGAVCHIPHGIANAIILPFGMEFNMNKAKDAIAGMLLPLVGADEFARTSHNARADRSIAAVRVLLSELNKICGLPITLGEAGVAKDKLEETAQVAIDDGAASFNPEEVEYEGALDILSRAY